MKDNVTKFPKRSLEAGSLVELILQAADAIMEQVEEQGGTDHDGAIHILGSIELAKIVISRVYGSPDSD